MPSEPFNFYSEKILEADRRLFLKTVAVLEKAGIPYFLEGGTLLGIVRDNDLLPWDHDIDLSVDSKNARKIRRLKWHFYRMGHKLSVRKSPSTYGPFKKGDIILIKIKPVWRHLKKEFSNIKASEARFLVCDIFVKYSAETHTYWQAEEKTMRVKKEHYQSFDVKTFRGIDLRLPANHEKYLTEKYGNWHIPKKDWQAGKDEQTIWEE